MEKDSLICQIFYMQTENKEWDNQYDRVLDKLVENDEFMLSVLKNNGEWLKHYKAVTNALDEYEAISVRNFYLDGFKFGFKLAMEIFEL